MKEEDFNLLRMENEFLHKLLNHVPASVHLLEIDSKYRTRMCWSTENYTGFSGISIEERRTLGFVDPYDYYHPDDAIEIIKGSKYIYDGLGDKAAFFCRFKNDYKDGWVYIKLRAVEIDPGKKHVVCLGFTLNDEKTFSSLKFDEYSKEIKRLKNQIKLNQLTKTETVVFSLLAKGLSTKDIANQMCRSFDTINNHRRSIFKKLDLHKISELVFIAKETGIV